MSGVTRVHAVFHLNLMFSSIEEEQRPIVIERCYWPLLRVCERTGMPLGLELTGLTLSIIEALDPAWIDALKRLIATGLVELIGSGHAQLIGPLVPADVNTANLRLGHQTYRRLLGQTPALALINEQCFSSSLVDHLIDAGYTGFLMEWDNPHRAHPDWDGALRHRPQPVRAASGRTLPVLWLDTIAFQKFQRAVHGADPLESYRDWLNRRLGTDGACLALYGNDGEVFDFRPGRFATEPPSREPSEWWTIEAIFAALTADPRAACRLPSRVLAELPPSGAALTLPTAVMPLPTKKQEKYNVLRWAVSGRNTLGINSRCLRLAAALRAATAGDDDWRELCTLYSSDFRTHITTRRWRSYLQRLASLEHRFVPAAAEPVLPQPQSAGPPCEPAADGLIRIERAGFGVELNARRGLAIHRFWAGGNAEDWQLGTLPFGYFDDIGFGADYYSGHLIFQPPGHHQITDLAAAPVFREDDDTGTLLTTVIPTALGTIEKRVRLHPDRPRLDLDFRLDWRPLPLGVLRLGHLTVNPEAFDRDHLWYASHNGGPEPERFALTGANFDHGRAVSHMVSAATALGMTEGRFWLGDHRRRIMLSVERNDAALVPMVSWHRISDRYFFRVSLSALEIDDTAKETDDNRGTAWALRVRCSIRLEDTPVIPR
ncbi:MAG: hypothetical protein WCO00_16670 [Rhodospirillaceae bacterium]